MSQSVKDTLQQDHAAVCALVEAPVRALARRAVRVWFNRDRLDQALSGAWALQPPLPCDLIYAIDTQGRQVSSNVYTAVLDRDAYHQDLSRRPYAIPTAVLNNAAFQGVFLCDTYISQVTHRPCVTLLYGVTSGPVALGFIAADLNPGAVFGG